VALFLVTAVRSSKRSLAFHFFSAWSAVVAFVSVVRPPSVGLDGANDKHSGKDKDDATTTATKNFNFMILLTGVQL